MAYTTFNTSIIAPGSGAYTFIKNFHDALITVGLTQTSDTGQLDLSTAGPTRSGTVNFSYGYTVYKLPSVSGLDDIYIRINHTNNADTSPIAYLPRITVGTGTDGAGNITTNSSTELIFATASVLTSSGISTHYVALTDGDLSIAFGVTEQLTGISQTYTISRLRDLDGTKKNGYWFSCNTQGVATINERIYNPLRTTLGSIAHSASVLTTTKLATSIVQPYLWYGEDPNFNLGTDIPVYPPTILTPEATTCLPFIWSSNDVTIGNTFTATRFGVTRTFLRVWGYPHNSNISYNIVLE